MDDFEMIEVKQEKENFSILQRYAENITANNYITDPSIARNDEIKALFLTLLTPDKSALLVGKPGIGKTAIVEGVAYRINIGQVPDKLKGYTIYKINSSSLVGTIVVNGEVENRLNMLIEELKSMDKVILFIDEIHTLIGDKESTSMDLANILKPAVDRGSVKIIGATTTDEYEYYMVKDRAFIRRFEKIIVEEPTRDQTIEILMGTLPKIEKKYGIKLKYGAYTTRCIMEFLTDATSEYKREYIMSSRYPDIVLTILSKAFAYAELDNKKYADLKDIYMAFSNSPAIYPDSQKKEIIVFKEKFKEIIAEENIEF